MGREWRRMEDKDEAESKETERKRKTLFGRRGTSRIWAREGAEVRVGDANVRVSLAVGEILEICSLGRQG